MTFKPAETKLYRCVSCGQETAKCQEWESSCGGHEDYRYICQDPECGYVRWVEGSDS